MNIGALIATLGVNTAGLVAAERSMKQFESRMSASVTRINAKLATTGKAMKKFGRGMTMYMTAPLALVGGAAFKMHMDFESSMSKIVGLVGVAREQVDQWSKDILQMAPRLGKAPKELAEAMFFVTSAGLRGAEAMDVLEMSTKASVAGLGEIKIVADLVTSAMNAYGSAVLNAEQATDVMVATVREGKAEADALTASMGMVLPIASNMGVAFHEVGAAVAAMTRTGTKAATASMQLRQILASLLKPTQQSKEILEAMGTSAVKVEAGFKAMGTSASYFRKVIREQGLLAALMEIKELSAKFGEEAMSTVFPNIRALSGVLDILGENLEDNIALFKRMGITTDSLKKAFEAAEDTVKHKWNVAISTGKTSLTILGKTVSEAFLPILATLTEKLQRLTDWFTSLSDAERQQVVRIAGIIAVIGPLSMILGVLLSGVSRLITIGYSAIKMFNALRLAMMANPALAIAAGIAILVTAIIQFTKKKKQAVEVQLEFNKALEAEGLLIGDTRSIEARMGVLETLNKRQVGDLLQRIENQVKIEEDYTAKLLEEVEGRGKIEMDAAKATELMQKVSVSKYELTEEEKTELAAFYASERTKRFQEENMKRLQDLEAYLILARMKLARFKDVTDVVPIIGRPAVPGRITGIGRFPTPPGEKLAAQARLIAEAWVKAAEAGRLYDTTITTGLLNMEEGMGRSIEMWEGMNEKMITSQDVWKQLGEQISNTEALTMLFASAINRVTDSISDMGSGFKQVVTAVLQGIQQIINALLAEAIAGMIAGEAKRGLPGLITAAIGVGILTALWKSKIPEFGEGVIATKPTLGIFGEKGPEAVIPLDKMNRQPIIINLIGEWDRKGEDIYYTVKEQERKHGNSF